MDKKKGNQMKKKDAEIFNRNSVDFYDKKSAQFIYRDLFQSLPYPEEYPAFIQIHTEYPVQSVPLHWHLGPEIIYSRNQELTVVVEGERFEVKPGECVLISCDVLHSIEPKINQRGQKVLSIAFNWGYIGRMDPELRIQKICFLEGTEEEKKKLCGLCEEIYQLFESEKVDYLKVNYLLFAILILVYQKFKKKNPDQKIKQEKNVEKIREILLYVKKHYREEITTQKVAAEFGYSREHFSRVFKRFADMSFKQYLNEYRLFQAANDLYTTERQMKDIALDNGFPDEKSFYTSFRRKYGMTPMNYRKEKYTKK